jgi:hypothetical protein
MAAAQARALANQHAADVMVASAGISAGTSSPDLTCGFDGLNQSATGRSPKNCASVSCDQVSLSRSRTTSWCPEASRISFCRLFPLQFGFSQKIIFAIVSSLTNRGD